MAQTFVLFDIDGTLLHSNKIDSECFSITYERIYQKTFPSIDWRDYPHVTDHTIFRTVIRDHFDREAEADEMHYFREAFVALLQEKRQSSPSDFLEVPNARSTVERLQSDDRYVTGIATGGWEQPAMVKLGHVGIPHGPMVMSFADNKVSRDEILSEAIGAARQQFPHIERVVYIGDAPWDVETTRRMKVNFIGIRRRGDREMLLQMGARTVFQDYSDYPTFVKAIAEAQPPN
ncbi:MAG: HAD hydrolase-like protein [Bacteroidota bacterium]